VTSRAEILRAEGQAQAVEIVFASLHRGDIDEGVLSYLYLEMLPELAAGEANKLFVIPSEYSQALGNLGDAVGKLAGGGPKPK
jgi:regulator of protease activity HflC (stomatin/prohibitin superfamily)